MHSSLIGEDVRPELLTVELPQSLEKQDDEVQASAVKHASVFCNLCSSEALLKRCKDSGTLVTMVHVLVQDHSLYSFLFWLIRFAEDCNFF